MDQAREKSFSTLAALPLFQVNDRFLLNQDEAWYTLSIETQVPLDMVMLQVWYMANILIITQWHDKVHTVGIATVIIETVIDTSLV